MENKPKRFYKVTQGCMISGVCAGVAEYFNIDPTIVRVLWAVLSLSFGTGIILYIICAIVFPKKEDIIF